MKSYLVRCLSKPAFALAVWLLSLQPAHCFYNPATGRWLSRDPIQENGGVNLCAFLGGNAISRVDSTGREFVDEGESYIFSAGYDKARTSSRITAFSAFCYCLADGCRMKLVAFTIESKSLIGVFDVSSIDQPPPFKPYSAAEIGRNAAHEAKHRNHTHQWHDENLPQIYTDFGASVPCGKCDAEINRLKQKWTSAFSDFWKLDGLHIGSDWTQADRTPTPGETNADPSTWLWTMPVNSLSDPWNYR